MSSNRVEGLRNKALQMRCQAAMTPRSLPFAIQHSTLCPKHFQGAGQIERGKVLSLTKWKQLSRTPAWLPSEVHQLLSTPTSPTSRHLPLPDFLGFCLNAVHLSSPLGSMVSLTVLHIYIQSPLFPHPPVPSLSSWKKGKRKVLRCLLGTMSFWNGSSHI